MTVIHCVGDVWGTRLDEWEGCKKEVVSVRCIGKGAESQIYQLGKEDCMLALKTMTSRDSEWEIGKRLAPLARWCGVCPVLARIRNFGMVLPALFGAKSAHELLTYQTVTSPNGFTKEEERKALLDDRSIGAMMLMVMHTLWVVQNACKANHNDLSLGNILCVPLKEELVRDRVWEIEIGNSVFHVPTPRHYRIGYFYPVVIDWSRGNLNCENTGLPLSLSNDCHDPVHGMLWNIAHGMTTEFNAMSDLCLVSRQLCNAVLLAWSYTKFDKHKKPIGGLPSKHLLRFLFDAGKMTREILGLKNEEIKADMVPEHCIGTKRARCTERVPDDINSNIAEAQSVFKKGVRWTPFHRRARSLGRKPYLPPVRQDIGRLI